MNKNGRSRLCNLMPGNGNGDNSSRLIIRQFLLKTSESTPYNLSNLHKLSSFR